MADAQRDERGRPAVLAVGDAACFGLLDDLRVQRGKRALDGLEHLIAQAGPVQRAEDGGLPAQARQNRLLTDGGLPAQARQTGCLQVRAGLRYGKSSSSRACPARRKWRVPCAAYAKAGCKRGRHG